MTWTFPCNKLFDNEEGVGKMDLVPTGAGGAGGVSARPRSAVDGGGRSGRGGVGGGASRPGSAYFGDLEGAETAFYEGSRPGSRRPMSSRPATTRMYDNTSHPALEKQILGQAREMIKVGAICSLAVEYVLLL